MAYASGNHQGPNRLDKGHLGGSCNVTACQKPKSAFMFHHSTRAHYCRDCADVLNQDNRPDAFALYGHDLLSPAELKDIVIEDSHGREWMVETAISHAHALNAIAFANVRGSVGGTDTITQNGVMVIQAKVRRHEW